MFYEKINLGVISVIKSSIKSYKEYYPYVFCVDIKKSEEFKEFISNSRNDIVEMMRYINIDNAENVFCSLLQSFNCKVHGNDTGFSILKNVFYMTLIEVISKRAEKSNANELISEINNKEELKDFITISKERNDWEEWNKWYRGQSNFAWGLIPSYFRNIKEKGVIYVDKTKLFNDYNNFGLVSKAHKTIGYSTIDYNFLSFIQHAVSFSPLIDFTSNPIVATVMGLSDTVNFREHFANDSALFELSIEPKKVIHDIEEVNKLIDDYSLYYSKSFPFMEKLKIHGQDIIVKDIDSLVEVLSPKYALIDIPTNDRMRYQSGKFVLFYDCLIVDQKIYAELADDMRFVRYKIDKSIKKKLSGKDSFLDELVKEHPEFSFTNMMNPYEIFGR